MKTLKEIYGYATPLQRVFIMAEFTVITILVLLGIIWAFQPKNEILRYSIENDTVNIECNTGPLLRTIIVNNGELAFRFTTDHITLTAPGRYTVGCEVFGIILDMETINIP